MLLLAPKVVLSEFGSSEEMLWWAAHENQCEIVESLGRDPSVDVNSCYNGATPFYAAVIKGHIDLVELMVSMPGVDLNKSCRRGASPFWMACRLGRFDLVDLLLRTPRVDVHASMDGVSPVEAARAAGHTRIVALIERKLLRKQAHARR
ncbi:hypothetical protein CTAYLR_008680 [Chrysophaeum taylorii]|uniref:Uncharacterized protein n=1 Tax=Chrysophaeum taylorii TaxID=2483200 RepID=A0AAD7XQH9_9STRA|nr:hypothetical protein CTAYLR_008680 [Chrysophaeum taylorii]